MSDGEHERTVAECLGCGSIYVARKWADGTIQAIGVTDCCCESPELHVMEDPTTPVRREGTND